MFSVNSGKDLDVASLPVPRSAVLRPRAFGSRNASDYFDKLPKLSSKKNPVHFVSQLNSILFPALIHLIRPAPTLRNDPTHLTQDLSAPLVDFYGQ